MLSPKTYRLVNHYKVKPISIFREASPDAKHIRGESHRPPFRRTRQHTCCEAHHRSRHRRRRIQYDHTVLHLHSKRLQPRGVMRRRPLRCPHQSRRSRTRIHQDGETADARLRQQHESMHRLPHPPVPKGEGIHGRDRSTVHFYRRGARSATNVSA